MMKLNTSDCKIVAFVFNLWKCPQVENEGVHEEETKEESDEEDEEDEESGRIRFKSERKDGAVVRLADAGSNRRIIPETLGTNYSGWAIFILYSVTTRVNSQIFSDLKSLRHTVISLHYLNLYFLVNVQVFWFPVLPIIRTVREG